MISICLPPVFCGDKGLVLANVNIYVVNFIHFQTENSHYYNHVFLFIENGEVIVILNIAKCLYDAVASMERKIKKGNPLKLQLKMLKTIATLLFWLVDFLSFISLINYM